LIEDTPWGHYLDGVRAVAAWGAFESRRPLRRHADWRPNRVPLDVVGRADHRDGTKWRADGARVRARVLPLYARALADLDEAQARLDLPGEPRCHPRARADLALGRFWLSMSRFHLHAFSLYAAELERFQPPEGTVRDGTYRVAYVDAIRLSDCLEAYDGRRITPEREAALEAEAVLRGLPAPKGDPNPIRGFGSAEGLQGNLLTLPETDPDYRARRDLDKVMKNLDPRLRADALDMIRSAERVMERYARTPWGWTVYYSVAHTFVWRPGWTFPTVTRRAGGSGGGGGDTTPRDKPPTTPKPPPAPGGGSAPGPAPSTPGGPTTPPGK
jgi:hypothetical protein